MKSPAAICLVLSALLAAPHAAAQARYNVGDTVASFTLTDRATGRPVQLTDFAGKVVLLEWFAWWCPFCQAAAGQIGPGIVRYYAERGGNAAGLPVLHVSLNLQSGQEAETQQFVNAYQLGLVLNDFDRAVANRFQSGGQPIFAVINGVAGSASHRPWELVFSQLGYGSTQAPIADLRRAIDAVRAPATTPAPVIPPTPTVPAVEPVGIVTAPTAVVAVAGASAMFTVAAGGTGPFAYQWSRNGVALPGGTGATLNFAAVAPADAGSYTVRVTGPSGSVTSAAALLTVGAGPGAPPSRLSNLSVLTWLDAEQTLTVGFTMQGGAKPVLLRAGGPALGALGVAAPMPDPRLALFHGGAAIASNDNWADNAEVRSATAAVGAFPFAAASSLDAALVSTVDGGRTLQVSGATMGTVIVEAYDAGSGHTPRLVNLSALHRVEPGRGLTAGFTVAGAGSKTVLIRAVGPGLAALGVPGALGDPRLTLFDAAQSKIAENDDWPPGLAAAFASVGAFALPNGGRDAALLVTLAAGGYSAQVGTAADDRGAVLLEIYEVP